MSNGFSHGQAERVNMGELLGPDDPDPEPVQEQVVEPIIDQSLKEAVRVEVANARSKAMLKLMVVRDWAAEFLGATIFPHVPTASLVIAIVALALAYPLAMSGLGHALIIVVPMALVAALLGLVSSQSNVGVIGVGLSVASIILAVAAGIYLRHEEQVGKNLMIHEGVQQAQEAGKKSEAELKAAEEAKARQEAAAAEKEAALKAAKKAEEEKQTAEYLKQQQLAADLAAAKEKKRKDEEAAVKQRLEDEAKRKSALELNKQAQDIKKTDDIEKAKATYREKSLKAEELTTTLEKLETAAQVAKDQKEKKETYLERRNSPSPPSEDDLAKAQKQYDEWKAELTRLQTEIPATRDALDKVTKEKKQASDLLDTLQKP